MKTSEISKIKEKVLNTNNIHYNKTNTVLQPSYNLKNNNNKNNDDIYSGISKKSLTSTKTYKTKNSTDNDFSE
jgi:hypothetical protein